MVGIDAWAIPFFLFVLEPFWALGGGLAGGFAAYRLFSSGEAPEPRGTPLLGTKRRFVALLAALVGAHLGPIFALQLFGGGGGLFFLLAVIGVIAAIRSRDRRAEERARDEPA